MQERSQNVSTLEEEWPALRALWRRSPLGAMATVSPDGTPQVTPLGSLYLHPTEPRGYYHPILVGKLRRNLGSEGRFQFLLLDGSATSWLPALIRGRFDRLVAARLSGHALGAPRATTEEERVRWERRVSPVRWTRGHRLLWSRVPFTQELRFDAFAPVNLGAMPHGSKRHRRPLLAA